MATHSKTLRSRGRPVKVSRGGICNDFSYAGVVRPGGGGAAVGTVGQFECGSIEGKDGAGKRDRQDAQRRQGACIFGIAVCGAAGGRSALEGTAACGEVEGRSRCNEVRSALRAGTRV